MAKSKTVTGTKVFTPKGRISYPKVFSPDSSGEYADDKYKATFLFDESNVQVAEGLKAMKKAVLEVAQKAFGAGVKLKEIQHPFRDGNQKYEADKAKNTHYKDTIFMTAKSKFKPGVVDAKVQPIDNEGDLYGGCYVKASLIPFSYMKGSNKGVSFRLCNIQKLAEGEPLGGGGPTDPTDDFKSEVTDEAESAGQDEKFDDESDSLGL